MNYTLQYYLHTSRYNIMIWDHDYVIVSKIIKDVKVPDVCLQTMKEVICNSAFRVVVMCKNVETIKI